MSREYHYLDYAAEQLSSAVDSVHHNIDSDKVLSLTRHRIGHFGDVRPSQSLGSVLKKRKSTQQKQATHKMMYTKLV